MDYESTLSISQKLSPTDIKNKDFKKVMMGYAPKEVVEFLDEVAKTWERVQKNEKNLIKKIHTLNEELDRWKAREGELNQIKEKAMAELEEIRNQATKEAARVMQDVEERAAGMRRGTEEWLAKIISELEETQRRKNSFLTAFKSSLDSHYNILTHQEEEEPLGAQLAQFLSQREKEAQHKQTEKANLV